MRKLWGMVCALALVGCATQSGSQQQSTTTAEGESQQQSSADANAISPERQDAIERVFARKTAELQDCWTKEYEKTHDRKLEGDLSIQMAVTPQGQATNVKILKSTLNNADIESCVTQQIGTWNFPEGSATVPYSRTVHIGAQF